MELPVLDKFCFVFNLRTGCIVMGVVNAIITFMLSALLITYAMDFRDATDLRRDDDGGMSSVVYTIVVLLIILLVCKFLLDLVFVYVVYMMKSNGIRYYCIFWIVFLVLFIIGFLKTLFHVGAGYVIAQVLFLAENFYYIVVIRSYLKSINEDAVL